MLERAQRIAVILVLLLAAAFLFAATLTALQIRSDADELSSRFDHVIDQFSATLEEVNRPCGDGKPCGLLADTRELLKKGGDAVVQAQGVTKKEQAFVDTQLPSLVTEAHGVLAGASDTTRNAALAMQDADDRIRALAPLEANAAVFMADLNGQSNRFFGNANNVLSGANALVTNPHIPQIIAHADGITASFQSMAATTDAVELKATHSYLHPSTNPFARTFQNIRPFLLPSAQVAAAVTTGVAR